MSLVGLTLLTSLFRKGLIGELLGFLLPFGVNRGLLLEAQEV